MAALLEWIRALFLPRTVPFVCEFSARHEGYDIHDYPTHAGGDGVPSHFYTYTCWNCGKEFMI